MIDPEHLDGLLVVADEHQAVVELQEVHVGAEGSVVDDRLEAHLPLPFCEPLELAFRDVLGEPRDLRDGAVRADDLTAAHFDPSHGAVGPGDAVLDGPRVPTREHEPVEFADALAVFRVDRGLHRLGEIEVTRRFEPEDAVHLR